MRFLQVVDWVNWRSIELTAIARESAFILVSNTHVHEFKQCLALEKFLIGNILYMMDDMCTSCAVALDGLDDGERCISIDTWHGHAYVDNITSHVQIRTCEVPFVIKYGHTCGDTSVNVFVSEVALHVRE